MKERLLIDQLARLLENPGINHVAVGAASPIPGAAALLARRVRQSGGKSPLQVSIIHGEENNPFTDGGRELFDCAGQGRIDAFFLGGAEIDGGGNINLLGTGTYPRLDKRFPGSYGSAYMYFVVPNIILFRQEHSRRVMVDKVDFISAPGTGPAGVKRTGGPKWLLTERCLMSFDANKSRFCLKSVHPGHTVEDVKDNTGFDFDIAPDCFTTPVPDSQRLAIMENEVASDIAATYPAFAARVFAVA